MFWTIFMRLCTEKKESPNSVASKCGVKSTGTVSGWKKGAMPRESILNQLADYFGVSVDYLLTGEETKKAPTETGEGLTENEIKLLEITKDFSPEELQLLISRANKIIESRD